MSKKLSEMRDEVLDIIQHEDDSSTNITNLKTDIDTWINNRYRQIWKMRTWPEQHTEQDIIVPASTNTVSLPSPMQTIYAVRKGTTALLPYDPSVLNHIDPTIWTRTSAPEFFIQRGRTGLRLLGQYDSATTLSVAGKLSFTKLENDNDTPCLSCEDALVAGAAFDAIMSIDRNSTRAKTYKDTYIEEIGFMNSEADKQQSNNYRMIPIKGLFDDVQGVHGNRFRRSISKIE